MDFKALGDYSKKVNWRNHLQRQFLLFIPLKLQKRVPEVKKMKSALISVKISKTTTSQIVIVDMMKIFWRNQVLIMEVKMILESNLFLI